MEAMKFKVGDKVRVKSLKWYNENKNLDGDIIDKEGKKNGVFTKYMRHWCGDVIKIYSVKNNYYEANNGWHWYDWMLEDEAVTEEKQEVNDVLITEIKDIEEIKVVKRNKIAEASFQPITKEQAKKLLVRTKFFCTAYADTDRLQKKLFECGCEWSDIGKKINIERWAIFVNAGGILTHENKEVVVWCENSYIPILIDDVLAIKIKEEEKPKFDPKTLQVFDKILVRCGITEKWRARFFDSYEDGFITANGSIFPYGVPYNEETKHLHGTTEEVPEYYRI